MKSNNTNEPKSAFSKFSAAFTSIFKTPISKEEIRETLRKADESNSRVQETLARATAVQETSDQILNLPAKLTR